MTDHLLLLVAKAMLAVLMALILSGASYVFVRALRASAADSGPGGFAWQAMLFAVMMALFLGAALGIPACRDLVVNGWGAIVGVCVALFGGWLAYKAKEKETTVTTGSPSAGPVTVTTKPPATDPPQEGL